MDFGEFSMPAELRGQIESEMGTGERVIWTGQPSPRAFARSSWGLVLFGIPWTAFSLFWMAAATGSIGGFRRDSGSMGAARWFFPLFGLPFVLIGFGMLSAPLWTRRGSRKTAYALTDRRALIIRIGLRGRITVTSLEPSRLSRLERAENRDGTGDLVFERAISYGNDNTSRTTVTGFIGIRDPKQVEDLIRSTFFQKGVSS
jgi:hypothetical protein